jgi:hypothetical protein
MEQSFFLRVYPRTLFDDILLRVRIPQHWTLIGFASSALLALIATAYLDGVVFRLLDPDFMRVLLFQPTVALYIIFLQFFLRSSRVGVTDAFRKILGLEPIEYHRFLMKLSPLKRREEIIALAVGALIGVAIPLEWLLPEKYRWTNLYLSISATIMFALVGWGAYSSLAVTRLFTRLHHQKLHIDIFHPSFVDAVAHRSLAIVMVYVGAIALSVLFFPPQTFRNVALLGPLFALMILLGAFIFLFSMYESHCLLVETKRRELDIVCDRLADGYRTLKERADPDVSSCVAAWLAYEKRIREAPEWPFNPETIRSLFAAMLMPLGTLLARIVMERF